MNYIILQKLEEQLLQNDKKDYFQDVFVIEKLGGLWRGSSKSWGRSKLMRAFHIC